VRIYYDDGRRRALRLQQRQKHGYTSVRS
jgi:hypothetical protein